MTYPFPNFSQWCNHWSLGMDKSFHPTLYWACDYLSMLRLKLIHVSKRDPWCPKSSATHWGRVTHICVGKLTIIGSDNGLSPERCQAIIWTNVGILLIGALGKNFTEIFIEIQTFSLKKMRLKVSSAKQRPFCLGLNVLTACSGQQQRNTKSSWLLALCEGNLSLPNEYNDLTLLQPSSYRQMSQRYQLHVCGYAGFGIHRNAYNKIYFCLNEAMNPYIEQILTT